MFKIAYDKKITMVQGDTGVIRMRISNYELSQGDEVRFAIVNKANPSILLCQHSDKKIVLEKQVTVFEKDGSARIIIYPYDTEYLQPGKYLYEIQVKTKDGRVDTVVPLTSFTLMDGSIQGEFGQTTPSKPEPTPSEIELRFKRLENEIIPELGTRITNVENDVSETLNLTKILTDIDGFSVNNNAIDNAKAINNYIANTTFDSLRLVVPNGGFFVDNININKANIIIEGDGTLFDCTINCDCGTIPKPNIKLRNFRLYNKNGLKTDAITLKCVRSGIIENITIDSYETAIHGLLYIGSYQVQHIRRVIINKVRYETCKNFFVNDMETGFAEYSLGDIQITNCTGSATINHLNLKGCDGLIFSNNVCFSGSSNGDMTKAENIRIDYGNFINISNNSLFEAGKEAIYITRSQNINITGNNIPWCGQAYPSYAIKLDGGAQTGTNKYVLANISNNIIEKPSRGGVLFEENIGYSSISNNIIIGAGSKDYYYGSEPTGTVFGITFSRTSVNNMCINNNVPQNGLNNLGENNVIMNNNSADRSFNYHKEITVSDGKTTIDVTGVTYIVCNNSNFPKLTDFTGGYRGQIITLFNYNDRTGIDRESEGTNIITKETSNFSIPAKTTITFQKGYGSKWYEIGRSF